MRRCRTALVTFALTVMALLAAGPALAGGPTSVLLVVPGTGQTASLYTGDPDYQTLAELVGAFGSDEGASTGEPSGTRDNTGPSVTVTWLIHDVHVWRVDRIYLGAEGGPWISTQTSTDGSGVIWDSPVVWHIPTEGKKLAALLDRLGVSPRPLVGGTDAAEAPAAGGPARAQPVAPAERSQTFSAQRADAAPSRTAGPVWGLAGLGLGVTLTMGALGLLRSFGNAEPNLTTLGSPADDGDYIRPSPSEPGSEPTWSLAEELSSLPGPNRG